MSIVQGGLASPVDDIHAEWGQSHMSDIFPIMLMNSAGFNNEQQSTL